MCEPVTIAMGIAAAEQAVQMYGKARQAKDSQVAANQLAVTTANNANAAARSDYQQLALNDLQASAQTSQAIQDNNIQAAQATASARVAAGESGVAGLSVDALLADLGGQAGANNNNLLYNNSLDRQQNNLQRTASHNRAASRINTSQAKRYRGVGAADYIGSALSVGSAGFDAYKANGNKFGWK